MSRLTNSETSLLFAAGFLTVVGASALASIVTSGYAMAFMYFMLGFPVTMAIFGKAFVFYFVLSLIWSVFKLILDGLK